MDKLLLKFLQYEDILEQLDQRVLILPFRELLEVQVLKDYRALQVLPV
jgi:hypothetical protein